MTDIQKELKNKIREFATKEMEDFDDYDTEEKAVHAVDKILQREFDIGGLYEWAEKVIEAHENSKVKEERINKYKRKLVDAHLISLIPEDRENLMQSYYDKAFSAPECDDIMDDDDFIEFVLAEGGFVKEIWYPKAVKKEKAQAT